MTDFWSILMFILRAIGFVLDIAKTIDQMLRLACRLTGSDRMVLVPADPKALTPAARRALAEAEARQALRYF